MYSQEVWIAHPAAHCSSLTQGSHHDIYKVPVTKIFTLLVIGRIGEQFGGKQPRLQSSIKTPPFNDNPLPITDF